MITNTTTSVLSVAAATTTGINGAGPGSDPDKNTQTKVFCGRDNFFKKNDQVTNKNEKVTIQDVQGKGKIKIFWIYGSWV